MGQLKIKRGLVLTCDQEERLRHNGHQIEVVPVWKWLLSEGTVAEC